MAKEPENKPAKKEAGRLLPLLAAFLLVVPEIWYLNKVEIPKEATLLACLLPLFSAALISLFWLKKPVLAFIGSAAAFVASCLLALPGMAKFEIVPLLGMLPFALAAVLALLWQLYLTKEVRAAKKAEKEAREKAKQEAQAEKERQKKQEQDEKIAKLQEKLDKGEITRPEFDEKRKKILGIKD